MEQTEFFSLIEQRLAALEARLDALTDHRLTEEVKHAIDIARVDQPFALAKARYVLEMIVRDIYCRERPEAKPKPLFNMIEALCAQEGLFSRKIATDINYIRINGNLIVHAQDEPIEITDRQVEVIVLVIINLVEWYLTNYLPGRAEAHGEALPLLPPPPNPYRGLLAFREEDAVNYFGREPDVADVLAAVERQPLVAVVGPSGSGKSSLVFAGVVAQLRAATDWTIATFRPRSRPFNELAQVLVTLWQTDTVDRLTQSTGLAKRWAASEISLTDTLQETLRQAGGSRLLLVADQFEELYTLGQEPAVTEDFIDLLVQAVEDVAPPPDSGQRPALCVLLTLRADFLGHALGHQGLAVVMDRYPKKLLGPVLDSGQLRSIIEKPAKRAGVELEDLLTERILRDLAQLPGTDPDQERRGASLPLLEFTLTQLWEQQHERRLTHLGYEGLGGIQQALSHHADRVYASFEEQERERVRHVLVQMVRPGEGTEDTRQVTTRDQVRPENWFLVTRLANQRLVVTGHDEASGRDTAEIIHEALIRHWQPLREWLREDRAFRLWQNGLRQTLAEWERTGKDPEALLAGARLVEAEERLAVHGERMSAGEVGYIQVSIVRREDEVAERERQRRDRERLQRRISFGLGGFLVVALALAGLVGWYWRVADNALVLAEEQKQVAEASVQEVQLQLVQSRHNLGLMFSEKAKIALDEKDYNAARLYSLYALARMKHEAVENQATARGRILNPAYPVIFAASGAMPDHDQGSIISFAFSPDGRLMALGLSDNTVRLWDMLSTQIVATLRGHTDKVLSVAFSPDGRLLASGSADNTVRLWEVASSESVAILHGHTNLVLSVTFSPDGQLLASGSQDSTARLWEVAGGQTAATLRGHSDKVLSVAFSPDGKQLATGSDDETVRLWNVPGGRPVATLQNGGFSVAFSPDGRLLASGSAIIDQYLRLWEVASGQTWTLRGHAGQVSSVAFSPDGRLLATGSWDNTVRLWQKDGGQKDILVATLRGHTAMIWNIAFSPDGRLLASTSLDNTMRLWDLTSSQPVTTRSEYFYPQKNVVFSPDGRLLASGSQDNTVRLWEVASGQPVATFPAPTDVVNAVAFSPDGELLASVSQDNTVRLWEVASGQPVATFPAPTGVVNAVAFSPDGELLASGSVDNTVRLWQVASGQPVATLPGHTGPISSLAFSPDGELLASGSVDNTVRLWEVASGQPVATLSEHTQMGSWAVAFSPDGELLALGSQDNTVWLWEVASGQPVATLRGHTDVVNTVAFSPDGELLASGSQDNTVRLWEVASGQPVATLSEHTQMGSWAVAFSPDGQLLASGSWDGMMLWELAALKDLITVSDNTIKRAERAFQMQLQEGSKLGPMHPEPNLYGPMVQEPDWPATHPFRWLRAAERGEVTAMVQIGLAYARSGDTEQARHWYRKAAQSGNAEGRERLALLNRHLTWQRPMVLWQQAQRRIEAGEHAQALVLINDLMAMEPWNLNVYFVRSRLYSEQKQYDRAIADLQQVISLAPNFAPVVYGELGWIRILQGRFGDGLELTRKAQELNPENLTWTVNLGHAHLLQGDAATARQYYQQVLPQISDDATFRHVFVTDFKLFIERGWQVEASRAELAWLKDEFASMKKEKANQNEPSFVIKNQLDIIGN